MKASYYPRTDAVNIDYDVSPSCSCRASARTLRLQYSCNPPHIPALYLMIRARFG